MCQVLPSRVVAVLGDAEVEVELADGQRVGANCMLTPGLTIGDYVLVDRGMIVERLSSEEAEEIIEVYRQMAELLAADAL
jgi:hydrogenase expression/formation protein HypC